MEKPSTI